MVPNSIFFAPPFLSSLALTFLASSNSSFEAPEGTYSFGTHPGGEEIVLK